MIIKIMDVKDATSWKCVCSHVKEAMKLAEGLPKILEDGEDFNEDSLAEVDRLELTLDGVIKEALYPAYIPTNAL